MSSAAAAVGAAPAKADEKAVEGRIKLAELTLGSVKELKVGDVTILVGQTKSGYFASGSKCTHYGAPLRTGAINGDRVTCPWHGACFHLRTGDIEDAPALSGLPVYPFTLTSGADAEMIVSVTQTEADKTGRRILSAVACDVKSDARTFVVVGGGPAALTAVETMRVSGYRGRIVMISTEATLPVDRPMLSKNLSAAFTKPESLLLRPASYFSGPAAIETLLQHEVTAIDSKAKTVTVLDRTKPNAAAAAQTIKFDKILIATGASPRQLAVPLVPAAAPSAAAAAVASPQQRASNVYTIRSAADAAAVFQTVDADSCAHAVILGSGFIGLEVASWLTKQEMTSITIVQRGSAPPLENVFGARIGKMLAADHASHNIRFVSGEVASLLVSAPDAKTGAVNAEAVVLKDGKKLGCQIVIAGLGATLNTGFLKSDPAIQLAADGGVVVNAQLETSVPGVYAAGDIAEYPCTVQVGSRARIEHYNVAHQHGRIAARNMCEYKGSSKHAYGSIPYFWTMQFASIRLCGNNRGYDDVVFDGTVEDKKFVAFYGKKGVVVAVATMGRDPVCSAAAELMRDHRLPSMAELKANPSISLLSLLASQPAGAATAAAK